MRLMIASAKTSEVPTTESTLRILKDAALLRPGCTLITVMAAAYIALIYVAPALWHTEAQTVSADVLCRAEGCDVVALVGGSVVCLLLGAIVWPALRRVAGFAQACTVLMASWVFFGSGMPDQGLMSAIMSLAGIYLYARAPRNG